ncbi:MULTISPECIES: hypothetical protein [Rhodococcus]|uniref:hypothetical protein n=1 Tax=Rhodococcus TaxID=1827 RepID=UPI0020C7C7A9|nr:MULTISPECIES: hypothetical protein [Rhodococcus]
MTGPPSPSDPLPESHGPTGGPPEHRTPRWVKAALVVVAVLVALIVAMMLLGDGTHGPSRHLSAPPTSAVAATESADPTLADGCLFGVVGT